MVGADIWRQWSQRFSDLEKRERLLIVGAALVAVLFPGFTYWVSPGMEEASSLRQAISEARSRLDQESSELSVLAQAANPQNNPSMLDFKRVNERLQQVNNSIRERSKILITPAEMPKMLHTLLDRHNGVTLEKMTTMNPAWLLDEAQAGSGGDRNQQGGDGSGRTRTTTASAGSARAGGDAASSQVQIQEAAASLVNKVYKHGVEITISGTYDNLLSYVDEIERSGGSKILLGSMRLEVTEYPISKLTLVLYTLSKDEKWLVV